MLDLTRQMLVSARQGDWGKLVAIEEGRRAIIEQGISSPVPPADAAAAAAAIQEVLRIDKEVIGLAETERSAVAGQLGDLRTKKKALKIYTAMAEYE